MNRRKLTLEAADKALKFRQSLGIGIWDAVCVYDVAERIGVEVRFVDIPSMEGMYSKKPGPLILVSSLRPSGRQAFTGAHELGHHVFRHGNRIDEIQDSLNEADRSHPAEFLADRFASFFLMPKSGVSHAFTARGWKTEKCTDVELYTVAGWFGVGYSTLIQHMQSTLNLLSPSHASQLRKSNPKSIRREILGYESHDNLVIVDSHWTGRAIDIQVADVVLLPDGTLHEGHCVRFLSADERGMLYCGVTPGIGRFYHPQSKWSAYVRVSRKDFVGRSLFRHLEEVNVD